MRDTASSITSRMAGDIFKPPNFMQQRENYQDHAVIGIKNRADEQNTAFAADAKVQGYGLAAAGEVASAEHQAEAIVAQGQAAGQASMMSGLSSGVSSLFGGMNFGGGGGGASTGSSGWAGAPMQTSDIDYSSGWKGGLGLTFSG